ncbi:MAG: S8 family serine peptidase, partial [Candidatus Thorarchaeota archaeon]
NILWRSADDDEHVILNPPSGDPIDLGRFSTVTGSAWQLEFEDLNAYVFADRSSRGTNRIIVQLSTSEHNWSSGSWSLTVTNPSGEAVWVDAYSWDNTWTGTSLTFTSMTDSQRTISSPGTADLGIVTTSYDESSRLISSTSSRGPRIDGFSLPTITAPGVGIRAASRSLTSLWSTRSGSSMAAPHIAGVLALIRQASDDTRGWTDLSALIEGAGGHDEHYSPANPSWGHGLCDAVWSVLHILEFDLTNDMGSWTGIPLAYQGATNLTISGSLDITEVRVNPEVEYLKLAVTLRSEANYSSDNVLRIQWDVDGSLGTGADGIDVVVNITDNLAQVFEWSVDQFQTSSLSTEWLNTSNLVSVSIQRVNASQIGQLTLSTHNSSLSSADKTSSLALPTLWRPTIDTLSQEGQDGIFDVSIVFADKDTPLEDLNVGWSVADGGLTSLLTGTQSSNTVTVSVDVADYDFEEILSVIFNCSDTSNLLNVPPLALSSGSGLEFEIISAHLDRTVIHVGPLIQEHLTGQIVITGADFASEVQLALLSFYGSWFNFTLIGSEGVYPIDILFSGFSPGNYEAYAVAHSQLGTMDELHLGTLSVVEDYSFALVVGGALLGVILIFAIVYIRRKRTVT